MIRAVIGPWGAAICCGVALGTLALPLGPVTVLMIALILAASFALGRALEGLLGLDAPFLGFVLGFTGVSYAIIATMRLVPLHPLWVAWGLAAATGALILIASRRILPPQTDALWIGLMLALFTLFWNLDMAPRLTRFVQAGQLDFWVDIFVHAAKLSEFGGPFAAGRGYALMSDAPAPLYHNVSYVTSALVMAVADSMPLATAVLVWIPMGVLVMAAGVVALGQALGGRWLALWIIPALALVPALDGIPLYNGLFSTPWLLETGPGAFFGLGLSAAALALLLYWLQTGRVALLIAALIATAAVFLVRVNFVAWLAPLVVIAAFCRPDRRFLRAVTPLLARRLGLMGLAALLVVMSWAQVSGRADRFLLSYLQAAHADNGPNAYAWLFADLTTWPRQVMALILSLPLMLLAVGGVWLILMLLFRRLGARRGALHPWDSIPGILAAIACIFAFLGPMPANGDLTEFRHRAVPLLLVVFLVWGMRFALVVLGPPCARLTRPLQRAAFAACAALALGSLPWTITQAKAPQMAWGHDLHGLQFSPDLMQAAAALRGWASHNSSLAVAGQSPDARLNDPAVILLAGSGVPAFLSCPQSILLRQDAFGNEARRRVAILAELDKSPDLPTLYTLMAQNGITDYVVIGPHFAAFDPDRQGARAQFGQVALYSRPQG